MTAERTAAQQLRKLEQLTRSLLITIGEDPEREGLRETPRRVARLWREFLGRREGNVDVTFEHAGRSQLVSVCGIRVWSMCEHHLLPFSCDLLIGYVAGSRIIGLSKIVRIARRHAGRLQVQERMVTGIADDLQRVTRVADIAVVGRGAHTCMLMRGVEMPVSVLVVEMRGRFGDDSEIREEFLGLVGATAPSGGIGSIGPNAFRAEPFRRPKGARAHRARGFPAPRPRAPTSRSRR